MTLNNFDFSDFIKSFDVNDQYKALMLLTYKELLQQAMVDDIVNSTYEGALITSIVRLYLYAEVIYFLSKNSNVHHIIQDFISELCTKAVEELKKRQDSNGNNNGHQEV